jgi:hypothetical protein
MKLKLSISFYSLFLFFTTQGQLVINMTLSPSMDESSCVEISKITATELKVIFTQRDISEENRQKIMKQIDEKGVGDKVGYFNVDSLVVLSKQLEYISLYDSSNFTYEKDTTLYKALNSLLENCDSLSILKDNRIILDGMRCYLNIENFSKNYKINYRAPQSKNNYIIHRFIKQVLTYLKATSGNKKVQDYCKQVLSNYMRDEGGAFVDFGELK